MLLFYASVDLSLYPTICTSTSFQSCISCPEWGIDDLDRDEPLPDRLFRFPEHIFLRLYKTKALEWFLEWFSKKLPLTR